MAGGEDMGCTNPPCQNGETAGRTLLGFRIRDVMALFSRKSANRIMALF